MTESRDWAPDAVPSTLTIVVTFRSVPNLRRCLEAIARQQVQVDRVIVVDNGRSADLANLVSTMHDALAIELGVPDENLGPADGFAVGLQGFVESDCDFAW